MREPWLKQEGQLCAWEREKETSRDHIQDGNLNTSLQYFGTETSKGAIKKKKKQTFADSFRKKMAKRHG